MQTAPMRDQLLDLLRQHDGEMTSAELAERVGKSPESVNSILCKAQIYGYVSKVDGYATMMMRRKVAALNKWKLVEGKR